MQKEVLTRALVESVVDRGIRGIREDPKRSVRKLVDLGEAVASGQFQKNFFRLAQQMLQNDESPYYKLLQNAVDTIDEERLKAFGINFGWGCLTEGAFRIRKLEASCGYNIPWSITLHIGGRQQDMNSKEYAKIISEGKQLGILGYILFIDGGADALHTALEIISAEPECVFFLFLPTDCEISAHLQALAAPPGVMLCLDSSGKNWQEGAALLRESGCLYAVYRTYSNKADVQEIVSGRWIAGILPYAGAAAICLAGAGCSHNYAQEVYTYVTSARLNQCYPTFIIDAYLDNLYTDRCISGDSCFLGILSDGTVTDYLEGCERRTGLSVGDNPLSEILKLSSR